MSVGLALAGAPAAAAHAEAGDPAAAGRFASPRLLDDLGGVRGRLEGAGVTLQLFYNQFLAWKPEGGADPEPAFGHSGSCDLFGLFDLEELTSWTAWANLSGAGSRLPRSYRAGVFLDGRRKQVFGRPGTGPPRTRRGHFGAYVSLDQLACREAPHGASAHHAVHSERLGEQLADEVDGLSPGEQRASAQAIESTCARCRERFRIPGGSHGPD